MQQGRGEHRGSASRCPTPLLTAPRAQINVYTLGAVFLQLARLLRLEEHPMFSK